MEPPVDLFLVEPEEFVAARDALARQLKSSGHAAAAAAVKALRRPTLPVWLLNLVAHEDPEVVERVRRVGADLRAAQSAALETGEGGGIRELAVSRRRVVDEVVRAALRLGGDREREVAAAHRDAIAATVEAALAADDLAAEWASARLRGVHDATGFNFGDVVPPTPMRPARPDPVRPVPRSSREAVPVKQPDPEQDRQHAANEQAARLRDEAAAARRAVDAARDEWAVADRAAKAAKQRLRDAERTASRADLLAATAEQGAWEAGERARR